MNMQLANTLQGILPMDDEFYLDDSNTNMDGSNIHGLAGSSMVYHCFHKLFCFYDYSEMINNSITLSFLFCS